MVDGLESGKRYHYRAYAVNKEEFPLEHPNLLKLRLKWFCLNGAVPPRAGCGGWWQSPWFGSFFMGDGNGWIRHEDLGWLYHIPDSEGVWLWQEKLGWTWTGSGIYPYLFLHQEKGWIFFHGSDGKRSVFYDFGSGGWIILSD